MPEVLIVYYSNGGNTRKMAEMVADAVKAGGVGVKLKKVEETGNQDLEAADGVILGSPCYFGCMANPMKTFVDESIPCFGKGALDGKPGACFASTGGIGGLGEVALLSMVTAMMIHGMVVMGTRKGGHFGPLSIGAPDQRVEQEIAKFGANFAALVKKLAA